MACRVSRGAGGVATGGGQWRSRGALWTRQPRDHCCNNHQVSKINQTQFAQQTRENCESHTYGKWKRDSLLWSASNPPLPSSGYASLLACGVTGRCTESCPPGMPPTPLEGVLHVDQPLLGGIDESPAQNLKLLYGQCLCLHKLNLLT